MKPNFENTPKAKAEFFDWYEKRHHYQETGFTIYTFYHMPFDFQQGVFLAYLRGVGISVESYLILSGDWVGEAITIHSPKPFIERLERVFKCTKPDHDTALIAAIEAGFARREAELNQKS